MKRYLMWIGTRPEAIKLCPLILALRRRRDIRLRVVLSGQHSDMVAPVLRFFGVEADADLGVMQPGQTPTSLTERLLGAMARELSDMGERPDACFVHGDTTTAFVGALTAFYAGIPVYHVEAGLRSDNVFAPFPEEFNRRAIDAMSSLYLAPTARAAKRLQAEGVAARRIFTVGNTATDALRLCLRPDFSHPLLDRTGARKLILLTTHRRELSPSARHALLLGIRRVLEGREDVHLIFSVHPSPAVSRVAEGALGDCRQVTLTPPLDLPVLQNLLARATLLVTDSGGMQEEATYLGVPTLVLRDVTERPEGVAAGVLRMVGTDPAAVARALDELLTDERRRRRMERASDVFGNGHAAEAIIAALDRAER